MNILVTGGCGYIGTVLVNYLLAQGNTVTVLDNLLYTTSGLIANMNLDGFRFINGDIRNIDDCMIACKKQDVVIHLAAIVGEKACAKNERLATDVNCCGTEKLYMAASQRKVNTFVFASTCSNYGKADMATENDALFPLGHYANTKVSAERFLLSAATTGSVTTIILRFATAFGLSQRMRFDLLINQLVLDAWETGQVEIYDKDFWRPFCHVQDISRAINIVINSCPILTAGQIFNVGGFNVTKEMLCLQLSTVFPNLEIVYQETGKGRDYSVDFGRINRLRFKAQKHIALGMIEMADALKFGLFKNPRKLVNADTSH